jgi:hypothetical protein
MAENEDLRGDALTLLRIIETYAGFIADNIETANHFDDKTLDDIKRIKGDLYNVVADLFGSCV